MQVINNVWGISCPLIDPRLTASRQLAQPDPHPLMLCQLARLNLAP